MYMKGRKRRETWRSRRGRKMKEGRSKRKTEEVITKQNHCLLVSSLCLMPWL
jgi:hypothetical protein